MKKNYNINIIKEDHSENDYLVVWSELGTRPNKINLYDVYDMDLFGEFLLENTKDSCGTFMDIVPDGENYVINERNLVKISDSTFISFVYLNKLSDSPVVSEVTIIYNNDEIEFVNEIFEKISQMSVRMDLENSTYRIKLLSLGQTGLDVEPFELMDIDSDNIETYFNDETIKQSNKLVKSLKKNDKGLSIIYGNRGCGKTSLVSWICTQIDKNVIYIPCSLIEAAITPDFRSFIKRYKNSVLIFDDMDVYFNEMNSKMNLISNNILQLVDGFQSDDLNLNIICIFNEGDHEKLDVNLLDCNNLIDTIHIEELCQEKCEELSKLLKNKSKYKSPTRLVDVIKDRKTSKSNSDIGF